MADAEKDVSATVTLSPSDKVLRYYMRINLPRAYSVAATVVRLTPNDNSKPSFHTVISVRKSIAEILGTFSKQNMTKLAFSLLKVYKLRLDAKGGAVALVRKMPIDLKEHPDSVCHACEIDVDTFFDTLLSLKEDNDEIHVQEILDVTKKKGVVSLWRDELDQMVTEAITSSRNPATGKVLFSEHEWKKYRALMQQETEETAEERFFSSEKDLEALPVDESIMVNKTEQAEKEELKKRVESIDLPPDLVGRALVSRAQPIKGCASKYVKPSDEVLLRIFAQSMPEPTYLLVFWHTTHVPESLPYDPSMISSMVLDVSEKRFAENLNKIDDSKADLLCAAIMRNLPPKPNRTFKKLQTHVTKNGFGYGFHISEETMRAALAEVGMQNALDSRDVMLRRYISTMRNERGRVRVPKPVYDMLLENPEYNLDTPEVAKLTASLGETHLKEDDIK